jgi:integrase
VSIPQLHALADTVPRRYRALVLVAGYGGLRWGELVGLRRHRVDLAGGRIHVVEQVVVLPAVAALAEHLEEFAAPEPDALVFPSGRGHLPATQQLQPPGLAPGGPAARAGGLRFHDLRHTSSAEGT